MSFQVEVNIACAARPQTELAYFNIVRYLRCEVKRTRSDFEKHFTIKNCDKTFLKIISRLKKLPKSDDVSTLVERHYQVKISE